MNETNKKNRRLVLRTETLRQLQEHDLASVAGGGPDKVAHETGARRTARCASDVIYE